MFHKYIFIYKHICGIYNILVLYKLTALQRLLQVNECPKRCHKHLVPKGIHMYVHLCFTKC